MLGVLVMRGLVLGALFRAPANWRHGTVMFVVIEAPPDVPVPYPLHSWQKRRMSDPAHVESLRMLTISFLSLSRCFSLSLDTYMI